MKRIDIPNSRCSERRRLRICPWIVTSSAVVGSSAIRRLGPQISARAIIARCRMPPENSEGKRSSAPLGSGMPTLSSRSAARRRASARLTSSCTSTTSAICAPIVWMGEKELIGSWKIIPMWPPRIAWICAPRVPSFAISARKPLRASSRISPETTLRLAPSSCISDSAVTLLPEPLSPTSASTSPRPIENEVCSVMGTRSPSLSIEIERFRTSRTGGAEDADIMPSNRGRRHRAARRRRS